LNRILKWATFVLGAVISVYILMYFTWESTKVVRYYKAGTVTSNVRLLPDSTLVFTTVDTAEYFSGVYPQWGDTLIAINDSAAVISRWNGIFFSPNEPGKSIPLEFVHNGQIFRTAILTHLPKTTEFLQVLVINILRFLVSISFIIVGIWAYVHRSASGGVRALTMFCYAMALFFVNSVSVLSARYAAFTIPLYEVFRDILNNFVPFFSAFWLNLQLLFPHPHRFIREKPVWAYFICYAPMAVIPISFNFLGMQNPGVFFFLLTAQIFAGFFILAYNYSHSRDTLERRQMRLVLMGSGFGLSMLFILLLMAVLFGQWLNSWGGTGLLITVCFIAILCSPLSFAYAFQRYRLFEVEAKLRRGTRYFIASTVLLAVLLAVLYLVGELLVSHLGITSRTPTIIIAMALAFGFTPAFKTLRTGVEKRFYPDKYRLREYVKDFSQKMLAIPDCRALWEEVGQKLRESMQIDAFYPIIRKKGSEHFYLEAGETEQTTPFAADRGIARRAAEQARPILIDEAIANEKTGLSLEEETWLISRNVAVLLPMVVRNELAGFLALGYKTDREEFPPDEILILTSLASQLALASDNIRLLEENLEKKRMEEELNMARSIQQGFLPAKLPETPGLEIAAGSRFCLEVAGDYYDVLAQGEGQTVLAVGDVSGKGAGAALLMANLQASLRTAVGISSHLKDIVFRINELIYINTPPEQYITFFVGVFDPDNKTLTYVDAGHNFPLVVRENCQPIQLDKGGLLLGCIPGAEYEQAEVKLRSGDILMMYTDGVTEAMNEAEEEFGEERLISFIRDNCQTPVNEIKTGLEKAINEFTGGKPLLDDFTLIVARIL